ncbi:MAG: hypothetical protein ABI551_05780, partial [Polyangiaceae bacterium]
LFAVGCGDATTNIEATEHGKRLNTVANDAPSVDLAGNAAIVLAPSALGNVQFRDIAGVVTRVSRDDSFKLHQWLLTEDGLSFIERSCPVLPRGVSFVGCTPWSRLTSVERLGLSQPIRSLSTFLSYDADGEPLLKEIVFDLPGQNRSERACPITVAGEIASTGCTDWAASEDGAQNIGVPEQTAFSDEVVVTFHDADGTLLQTQQLVSVTGLGVWARTCPVAELGSTGCTFSKELGLAEVGIDYAAIQGLGGYTYEVEGQVLYAETVIAADSTSTSRRICPVTADGIRFDECSAWTTADLRAALTSGTSAL